MSPTCRFCGFAVTKEYFFCPNCGKKLQEPPKSTTIGKQIYIYAISILLPPLGLAPGIKYLLDANQKAKLIGIIAISLTIISTVVTFYISLNFLNSQLQSTSSQLNQLQDIGY